MNSLLSLAELSPRASLLIWLSGVFAREPDEAVIAYYRSEQGQAFLDALAQELGSGAAVSVLRAAVCRPCPANDVAFELAGVYADLFLGAGGPGSPSPYESVWRDEGRLCGRATGEVDALLARHGIGISLAEPADHVAVELQLLAQLLAQGSADGDGLLRQIGGWVPAFCAVVIAQDPSGFYAAAARILAQLLAEGTVGPNWWGDGRPCHPGCPPAEDSRAGATNPGGCHDEEVR